jgi:hypothetical protein
MLIKFGFGAIHFGPLIFNDNDAGITVMLGKRDAPADEWQWRHVWHVSWKWPRRVMRAVAPIKHNHWSGKPYIDSSRWTGRTKEYAGFSRGSITKWSHHTTTEAKMHVYLNGEKERKAPRYNLYVAPAAILGQHMSANDVPADWIIEGRPRTFTITFNHGKAEVPDNLGELLIKAKVVQRTRLIVSGTSLFGSLARKLTTQAA